MGARTAGAGQRTLRRPAGAVPAQQRRPLLRERRRLCRRARSPAGRRRAGRRHGTKRPRLFRAALQLAGDRAEVLRDVRPACLDSGGAVDGTAAWLVREAPAHGPGGARRAGRPAVGTGRRVSVHVSDARMKLAFVTPRYGGDITCGAEHACRLLAEQVCERHDVDVLTTCARDPLTWKNESMEGADRVRGVLVRRFAVNQPHDPDALDQLTVRLIAEPHGRADEQEWVRRLGPSSPGLIDFLKRHHRNYDAVVFFSLYHATTVQGIAVAPERAVLFPHLQIDPILRFGLWSEVLESVRGVGFASAAERRL